MLRTGTQTALTEQANSPYDGCQLFGRRVRSSNRGRSTREIHFTRNAFAPVAYGSKTFSPAQLKMSIYAKDSWQFSLPSKSLDISFGEPQNR